jgi:cellulose synthase operon protein C
MTGVDHEESDSKSGATVPGDPPAPSADGPLPETAPDEESATGEVELLDATPTPVVLPIGVPIPASQTPPALPTRRPPPLPKGLPPNPRMESAPPLPPLRRSPRFGGEEPFASENNRQIVTPSLPFSPGNTATLAPVASPVSAAGARTVPLPDVEVARPRTVEIGNFSRDLAIADARKRVEQASSGDRSALVRAKTELGLLLEVAGGDSAAALAEYRSAHGMAASVLAPLAAARRLTPFRPAAPALALLEAELRATTDPEARIAHELELGMLLAASSAPSERTWQAYRQILAVRPSHPGALRGLETGLTAGPRAPETQLQIETLASHLEIMAAVFRSDARLSAWLEVERGQLLDRLGRADAARAAFEAALALDGQIGPVRDAYGRHLLMHGQVEDLVHAWTSEAGLESDGARAGRLLYFAGRLASERLDQKPVAIDLFERVASRYGAAVSIQRASLRELWRLYDLTGNTESSVATGRRLLALAHDSETAYFHRRLLQGCEALGQFADMAAHAYQVLAAEPDDEPMRAKLDQALAAMGQHAQRVAMFTDQAARTTAEHARIALLLRAADIAEHAMGSPEVALLALRSAWAIAPSHPDVTDAIVRLLTPGTPPSPTDPDDPSRVRARIDFYVEAAAATESARRVAHLEKLALIWEDEVRDPARALAVYDDILRIEPSRRSAILGLARCAARAGDARALFRALVLEADLSDGDPAVERALLLRAADVASRQLGEPETALDLVKRVLARSPGDPTALRAAFRIHENAGRYAEALAQLRLLLAQAGKGQGTYPIQAEIARFLEERLHRPTDALAAWRDAHRMDPSNPTPRAEIRRILLANGDYRLFAEELAGLAATTSNAAQRGELLLEAAEIYDDRLGDAERAVPLLAEARACIPDDPAVAERLERTYLRTGKRLERLALLQATETPEPRCQFTLGSVLVEERDPAKGLKRLADVSDDPTVSVAALRALEHALRRSDRSADLDMVLRKQVECFATREAKLGSAYELLALEEYGDVRAPDGRRPARDLVAELAPDRLLYHELVLKRVGLGFDGEAPLEVVTGSLATLAAAAPDALTAASLQLAAGLLIEHRCEANREGLEQALMAYATALESWPDCLTAARGLHRVAYRLGDTKTFGQAAMALGGLELDGATRCERLLEAAEGCRDRAEQPENANSLACRALAEDPNSRRAADAVIAALAAGLDPGKAAEALRAALDKAMSPDQAAKLGAALAHVALGALNDPTVALEGLRRARKRSPKHVGNLLALADVSMTLGLHAEAVEAATSAMGISRDPAERLRAAVTLAEVHVRTPAFRDTARREAMEAEKLAGQVGAVSGDMVARLGNVFRSLGDEDGAERVLIQAVLLAPEGTGALDNLCNLFGNDRPGAEKATATLTKVIALAESNGRPTRAEWMAVIGKLEATVLDKPGEGLAKLRDAIELAPDRVEIYGALADAHGGATDAAIAEVTSRLALFGAAQPAHDQVVAMLALLARLYRQPEKPAAAADELLAFFAPSQALAQSREPLPASAPLPFCLPRGTIVARLLPDDRQAPLLDMAALLADAATKAIRQEPEAFGTSSSERLTSGGDHPVRKLADRIARAFGELRFDLYLDASATDHGRLLSGHPAALVLPSGFAELAQVDQAAELARLLTYVALDIAWVDQATPENVDGILFGALRVGAERWGEGELSADAEMNAGLWRPRIAKGLARRTKRSLEEAAQRIRAQADSALWRQAMCIASLRAAYVVTGDLAASLGQVLRIDRELGESPRQQFSTKLFGHPLARELVLFALSDASLVLRQSAGTA